MIPGGINNLLSQVSKTTDAYRNNPRALEQQTKVKSGVQPDLIKLISLQQLKEQLAALQRDNMLKIEQTGKTVADQLGEDVLETKMSSVNDKLAQVASTMNQRKMAQNKAMNNMVKNATKFKSPSMPMGVAGVPRKRTQFAADGGIIGYSSAGRLNTRDKEKRNKTFGEAIFGPRYSGNPLYPYGPKGAAGLAERTAPATTETLLEGDGGPDTTNLEEIVKKAPTRRGTEQERRALSDLPESPSEFNKDGPVTVVDDKPKSGNGGSGGLGNMYFDLMKQIREQRQAEDPYRGLRYILGQGADPYQIPGAAERFRRGEEAVARSDAGTAMGFKLKEMEIGARSAAAKIAAKANALAKANLDFNQKFTRLQQLTKEYNALTMQFGSIGTNSFQVRALLNQVGELEAEYNETKDPELIKQINDIQLKEIPRVLSDIPEIKETAERIALIEAQLGYGKGD